MEETTVTTETQDNAGVETAHETTKQEEEKDSEPKKYTDADVDKIVDKKFAKFKAELEQKDREKEQAVEEAKKLEKMNAEEKSQYELDKLREENERLRKAQNYNAMSKEAAVMLSEHDLAVNDDLLALLVRDDAEGTKSAVEQFVKAVNTETEAQVKKRLGGDPPKAALRSEPADVFAQKLQKYQ